MKYSFNRGREGIVFAHAKDVNASFKDLCSVCDSIRYLPVPAALRSLEATVDGMPIEYRRYNKGMGSRHELGGRKGRTPMKCASIVRKVLLNAMANSRNKGYEPDVMYVVHAAANKTNIIGMPPPKGKLFMGAGYGYATARRSDLEFAKIELGIAKGTEEGLSDRMKSLIKVYGNAYQKESGTREKEGKPKAKQARPAPKPRTAERKEQRSGKESVTTKKGAAVQKQAE